MWKYTREGHGASFSESSRNASTASLLKVSYPSLHALDDTEDMRGIRHKMLRKAPMEASELLPPESWMLCTQHFYTDGAHAGVSVPMQLNRAKARRATSARTLTHLQDVQVLL